MAANSEGSGVETFRLFQSKDEHKDNPSIGGLGFLDFPESPLPPPPPSVEVLPSEGSSSVKYTVEKVDLGAVTLLKGRVSTQEVFKLSNSDLVPGKYEGGLKLWEGSLDLVKALASDIQKGCLSFEGKRVLEVNFLFCSLDAVMDFLESLPALREQLLCISRISMQRCCST